MLKKIYNWLGSKVHTKYANPFFCILFYLEAIVLIPVDPILILYCLENRKKSLKYALMATISSVLGGITGYLLGSFLWTNFGENILNFKLISYIVPQKTFYYLKGLYHTYATWAILISGFTPIPYKAATLSAGFCQLPIIPFIFFSCLARGARFFLVAIIITIWGKQIKYFIDRYFNLLSMLFVALVIFIILFIKGKI
ncbi:YqaA family protein [Candidatus Dependentiae bacterium]